MNRRLSLGVVLVLLGAMVVLGGPFATGAQSEATPTLPDLCTLDPDICQELEYQETDIVLVEEEAKGESVFSEGATADLLAIGAIPAVPSQPAAIAMQRVRIAPGGRIVTPADDPRVVLLYVESGTLTVSNTAISTVTRGALVATPGAQTQETIPAGTEFTMSAGDSSLSPAGSGGEWRNDGTEEVIVLAALIVPIPTGAATPGSGTPVP
jgi:hypothetical protein